MLAVSGGADSVALLRGTLAVARELELIPLVAHLDHALRPDSEADAAWVAGLARTVGVESFVERRNVASAAFGRGLEETARAVRYGFLARVATTQGASFVVTAHSADDQAETVLFQLLRGSGLRGLRGIPQRRRLADGVKLVRPLLGVSRAEIEAYLASIGQGFLSDASNTDPAFTRNRLRHQLLPALKREINPKLDEALLRLSRQAGEASEVLARAARRELRAALIESSPHQIRIRCDGLRRRPRALIREIVATAWRRAMWPRQAMGFAHWEALAELVVSGGRRTLPGGADARRRRGELVLSRRPG